MRQQQASASVFLAVVVIFSRGVNSYPFDDAEENEGESCFDFELVPVVCDVAKVQLISTDSGQTCDLSEVVGKISVVEETSTNIRSTVTLMTEQFIGMSEELKVLSGQEVEKQVQSLNETMVNFNGRMNSLEGAMTYLNERMESLDEKITKILAHVTYGSSMPTTPMPTAKPCNNHTFKMTPNEGTFNETIQMCRDMGGRLLEVLFTAGGKKHKDAIVQTMADFNKGNHYFVGMSDGIKEGEWQLLNGDIHDASDESQGGFWQKGQPNNSRGQEDCAILRSGLFLLYDVRCGWKQHGICELNEC